MMLIDVHGELLGRTVTLFGVALAILIKFAIEHQVGAQNYCSNGSYTQYSNDRYAHEGLARRVNPTLYQNAYVIKWVAASILPFGGWVTVAGGVLLAGWFLTVEIAYDYKHHTVFLGLASVLLALTGPKGLVYPQIEATAVRPEPELMVTAGLCQVYLSSAYIKLRSGPFRDGTVIANLFEYLAIEQYRFERRETWLPPSLVRTIGSLRTSWRRELFRAFSIATIACELAMVPLLLIPECWLAALILGALMHLSFTALLPWRLAPFFISILSLYWMVPPWT